MDLDCDEIEGKSYQMKRFLEDASKSVTNKDELKEKGKEKPKKRKKKQVKLPILDSNRGIFENVIVGKTFHRANYSPLQKARMNEDIFALAKNRAEDEVEVINKEIQKNVDIFKHTEAIEDNSFLRSPKKNTQKNYDALKDTELIGTENLFFRSPKANNQRNVNAELFKDTEVVEENIFRNSPKANIESKESGRKKKRSNSSHSGPKNEAQRFDKSPIRDLFNAEPNPESSKRHFEFFNQTISNNFRKYRTKSSSSESESFNPLSYKRTKKMEGFKDYLSENSIINQRKKQLSYLPPKHVLKSSNFMDGRLKSARDLWPQEGRKSRKRKLSPHTY